MAPVSHMTKPLLEFPSRGLPTRRIDWENAYPIVEPQTNADGIHQWPFDPVFPLDVRFFLMARRNNIRLTRHEYFELLYVDSGEAVYQIQDRLFTVKEGDLLVISGSQYHRMREFHRPRVKAAMLYFMPDLIRANETSGESMEYLVPFLVQDSNFPHLVPSKTGIPAEVFCLMKRIQAELPACSPLGRLTAKTFLKMILILLVKHYAGRQGTKEIFYRKRESINRLRPLFEHIDLHYGEPITIEDAASLVCLSKSHFMKFFKRVTGQAFVAYLNHFRIAKAQVLLTTTDLPISEISQEVGFCDQSYFGLVFRKLVHVSPREYKLHAAVPQSLRPNGLIAQ